MEKELKPCPFCGGEAHICLDIDSGIDYETYYFIHCKSCHVTTDSYITKEQAADMWNDRVTE